LAARLLISWVAQGHLDTSLPVLIPSSVRKERKSNGLTSYPLAQAEQLTPFDLFNPRTIKHFKRVYASMVLIYLKASA
jgi:hypothetical protein